MITFQMSSAESLSSTRHDRVPGFRLLRQARPALGDPPEQIGLLQHRDSAGIGEVGGGGLKALGEVAGAVQVVPRGSICSS